MGNNEVSPVATTTGQLERQPDAGRGRQARLHHPRRREPRRSRSPAASRSRSAPIPNVSDPSGLNCVDLPVAEPRRPDAASAPARTSRRSRSTRPETSTPSGSRRRTTAAGTSATRRSGTRTRPTRATTGRRRADPDAGAREQRDGLGGRGRRRQASTSPGTGRPRTSTSCDGGPRTPARTAARTAPTASWSVYLTQTLNGHAGRRHVHARRCSRASTRSGTAAIQTIIGNQCGGAPNNQTRQSDARGLLPAQDRQQGEAKISYADSNNSTTR